MERKILEMVYKLQLPKETKIHPVFNVNRLRKAKGDRFRNPPLIVREGQLEYEVEDVTDFNPEI